MKPEALFLNGVYEAVLDGILQIQSVLPEQILFLRPHSARTITHLRDDPPSVDDPMQLFVSITTDLSTVRYAAEVVGWDDQRKLPTEKRHVLNRLVGTLQPGEGDLPDASRVEGDISVNLLHIRRLQKLQEPFGVERLIKTSDNTPVSPTRTTSGGWAYVRNETA